MRFLEIVAKMKRRVLIVDGYNMIAYWQETKHFFKTNQLEEARDLLLKKLSHYAGFEELEIICVFDAQYVPGVRQVYDHYQLQVVFTEEGETADAYIERLAGQFNRLTTRVSVATSDLNEQWLIFSQGALRVSARELEKDVNQLKKDVASFKKDLDLTKPPLRPWNADQLDQLQDMLDELGK